jgi:hypothetical protein
MVVSMPVNIITPDKRDRVLKCFSGQQRITSKKLSAVDSAVG